MGKRTRDGLKRSKSSKHYRLFISHATADKWIARVLYEKLEAHGVETFATTETFRAATTFRMASERLSREFARLTGQRVSGQKLASELLRMRKQGQVPRLPAKSA